MNCIDLLYLTDWSKQDVARPRPTCLLSGKEGVGGNILSGAFRIAEDLNIQTVVI